MNASRRETILNLIGLGLLASCFLVSLGRIFGRVAHSDQYVGKTTIRFAHWQLESGLREAYDQLANDYMRLHPDVRVEQMPVPESVYANWLRTQLVGGTAPELVETGRGDPNEILATYFEPITPWLEAPNPYNAHNDLARIPWRNTFGDGLSHSYNEELLEYYDVPNSLFTVRLFYNRALWREVFGTETPPRTYEELMDDCRRAAAYRNREGGAIVPIIGSHGNTPCLTGKLFSSQTQRLYYSLSRPGEVYPSDEELCFDFLAGKWSFDTPAVRDGLELARSVGRFLPEGFLQLAREDALFTFGQGRALMTVTGSWDAPSIRSQAPFEVGIFEVPIPARDNPRYGRNTVGEISEAGTPSGLAFGMIKQSSAAKQAKVVDFLRFLTSRDANEKFSMRSGWLPAVVGVRVQPAVQPFLPRTAGDPAGFTQGMCHGASFEAFGAETSRIKDTNMYRLFDADGSPAAYAQAISGEMRGAVVTDLNTMHRNQLDTITRQDTTLAAYRTLARQHAGANPDSSDPEGSSKKVSELDEQQTREEVFAATRQWKFRQLNLELRK